MSGSVRSFAFSSGPLTLLNCQFKPEDITFASDVADIEKVRQFFQIGGNCLDSDVN